MASITDVYPLLFSSPHCIVVFTRYKTGHMLPLSNSTFPPSLQFLFEPGAPNLTVITFKRPGRR